MSAGVIMNCVVVNASVNGCPLPTISSSTVRAKLSFTFWMSRLMLFDVPMLPLPFGHDVVEVDLRELRLLKRQLEERHHLLRVLRVRHPRVDQLTSAACCAA